TVLLGRSLRKGVRARIWAQVAAEEEDGRSIIVARGSKVPRRHTGGELRAARLAEPPEAPPDEARRRRVAGSQELRRCRRRKSPHALDAALADRHVSAHGGRGDFAHAG